MAQKASPNLVRLGYNKIWKSEWSGLFNYSKNLMDDLIIRNYFSYVFYCLKCPTNYIILKRSISSWLYVYIEVYLPEDQRRRFYILFNRSFYKLKDKRINVIKKKQFFFYSFHSLFYKFNRFGKFVVFSNSNIIVSYIKNYMFLLFNFNNFIFLNWYFSFFFYLFSKLVHSCSKPVFVPFDSLTSYFDFCSFRLNHPYFFFKSFLGNKLAFIKSNICRLVNNLFYYRRYAVHYFRLFHTFVLFVRYYRGLSRVFKLKHLSSIHFRLLFLRSYIKDIYGLLFKNHSFISIYISCYFTFSYFMRYLLFSGIYYSFFLFSKTYGSSLFSYMSFVKTFTFFKYIFLKKIYLKKKRLKYYFPLFSLRLFRKLKFKKSCSRSFFSLASWFVRILRIKMLSVISRKGAFKRYIRSGSTLAVMKQLSSFLKNPLNICMMNVLRYRFFLYFKKLNRRFKSYKIKHFIPSFLFKTRTRIRRRKFKNLRSSSSYYRNSLSNIHLSFRTFFLKRFFRSSKTSFFNKRFFVVFFNTIFLKRLKSKKYRRLLALYHLYLRERHHYLYRSGFKYKFKFKFRFNNKFKLLLSQKKLFFRFLNKFQKVFTKKSWYYFNKFNSIFSKRKYGRFFKFFRLKYKYRIKLKKTRFFTRSIMRRRMLAQIVKKRKRRSFLRLFKRSLPFSRRHMSFFYKHKMYASRVLLHLFFKRKFRKSLIIPHKFIPYKKKRKRFMQFRNYKTKFRTLKFTFPRNFHKRKNKRFNFKYLFKRKHFKASRKRFKSKTSRFYFRFGFLRRMNLISLPSFFNGFVRNKNNFKYKYSIFTYNKLLKRFAFFIKRFILSHSSDNNKYLNNGSVFFYNPLFSNLSYFIRSYSSVYKFQSSNYILNCSNLNFFRTFFLNHLFLNQSSNSSFFSFYFFKKKIVFFMKFYKRYLRFFCFSFFNFQMNNKYFLFRKILFYLFRSNNCSYVFLLSFLLRYCFFFNKINLYRYLLCRRFYLKYKNYIKFRMKSFYFFKNKSKFLFSSRLRLKVQSKIKFKLCKKKRNKKLRRTLFRNEFLRTYLKYHYRFFYLYRNKSVSLFKKHDSFYSIYNSFRRKVVKRFKYKRGHSNIYKYTLNYNNLSYLFKQFNFTLQSTLNNYFKSNVCLDIRYFINNRRPLIKSASLVSDFVSFELKKGVPINEVLSDLSYWFRIDRKLKSKLRFDTKFNLMDYVQSYYTNLVTSNYFYYMRLIHLKRQIQGHKLTYYYRSNYLNLISSPIKSIFGYRVMCSGRPFGQPRTATYTRWYGKMPLSTVNYNVDYSYSYAITKYGVIGIKVWIFFG